MDMKEVKCVYCKKHYEDKAIDELFERVKAVTDDVTVVEVMEDWRAEYDRIRDTEDSTHDNN